MDGRDSDCGRSRAVNRHRGCLSRKDPKTPPRAQLERSRCSQPRRIDRLGEDALSKLPLQGTAGDEVDGVAEEVGEVVSDALKASVLNEPRERNSGLLEVCSE